MGQTPLLKKKCISLLPPTKTSIDFAASHIARVLSNSTAMPFRFYHNKFKCFYCTSSMSESAILIDHTLKEHSGANIEFFIRHNMFNGAEHVKVDISNLSCTICKKSSPNLDTLVQHLADHHQVNCNNSYTSKIISYKLSNDFECATCKEKFDFFGSLIIHMNKHLASWPCEVCGASFSSKSSVRQHIAYTHKEGGYPCQICQEACPTKGAKRNHDAKHHKNRLKCKHCAETFQSPYKRRRHLAAAHNEKLEHQCQQCEKSFICRSVLLNHVKNSHFKEKNHCCDICGDRFFRKYNLKLHMVKHFNDKKFACEYCKKMFARKKNLELHVRTHTDDRRCVCKVCGKAYVQTASLKLHLRVHHPNQNL